LARKSKADRIHEILLLNPALRRDDPRIDELINAEAILRRTHRAARNAPVTVQTGTGFKRSPELVAVDNANTAVRRLRNELGIDRLSVKRSEDAGVKVKRTKEAQAIIDRGFSDFGQRVELLPGICPFYAAHGITAEDLPEEHRERFRQEVDEANRDGNVQQGIADRIRQYAR
jgi:hypothetical protein